MRINPKLEPLNQIDFASIIVVVAFLLQHWLQTEVALCSFESCWCCGVSMTCCIGNSLYSCPGTRPIVHNRIRHFIFVIDVNTTRETTITGYKPQLTRRARRQGSFLSMGGVFKIYWTVTIRHKLGNQKVPSQFACSYWVCKHQEKSDKADRKCTMKITKIERYQLSI